MGLFRYFVYQFFYFVVLRNFNFYRIYSFATFFKNKDKNYVKKNLIKIQNKNNYKFNGIAITSSNLNLNNPNNILLISSLMSYFREIGLKPLIFNTFQYKKILSNIYFTGSRHLLCFSTLSFFEARNISNNVIIKDYKNILNFKLNKVSCGKYAISSTMRMLRLSNINLDNRNHRRCLLYNLRKSIIYADASKNFIKKNMVKYALFNDRGYCGEGELYDVCIENRIKCIQFISTYKNGSLLLKKYSKKNKDHHPGSVTSKIWNKTNQNKLNPNQKKYLYNEIKNSYNNNTWYPSAGTMVGKKKLSPKLLIDQIGIKNKNKIAVIFPHIFWDGTFFYGKDIYYSYEDWYKKTLIAAKKNKNINWIIKAHPSNVVKNKQDNIFESQIEPELKIIIDLFGSVPKNFFYINSVSKINTYYLFNVLNYVITVRGTVAMEAAMRNQIAITAGTGRYDNKKFTFNFSDKNSYEKALINLPKTKFINKEKKYNADKFAYLSLICKNFEPSNINFYFEKTLYSNLRVNLLETEKRNNKNILNDNKYIKWLLNNEEDFFNDPQNRWKF